MLKLNQRLVLVSFLVAVFTIYGKLIVGTIFVNYLMVNITPKWTSQDSFYEICGTVRLSEEVASKYELLERNNFIYVKQGLLGARLWWLTGNCSKATSILRQLANDAHYSDHPAVLLWNILRTKNYSVISNLDRMRLSNFAVTNGDYYLNELNDYTRAENWYIIGFSLDHSWQKANVLANFYEELNQENSATEVWQELVSGSDKTNPDHWSGLASLALQQEDWQKAAQNFEKAALLSSSNNYFMDAGDAWLSAGNYQKAENAYLQAINNKPDVKVFIRLGDMAIQQNKIDLAIDWYERALEINADDPDVLQVMAQTFYLVGDVVNAEIYVRRALSASPNHSWSLFLLAQMEADKGDISQASELARHAIQMYPNLKKPQSWIEKSLEWDLLTDSCSTAQTTLLTIDSDKQIPQSLLDRFYQICAK